MSDRSNVRSIQKAVLSMLSVFALGMAAGAANSATVVPWLNQPAAAKPAALPAPAQGMFPCSGNDVRVAAGPAGAWHGQATQEVRITNVGTSACHLVGFPSVQLMPSTWAPQTVGASDAAPQLANERIDLAPGDVAVLLLGVPGACEAANRPQRNPSRRLQLALPGGGLKVLDGVYIDTLCGRATVMQFHTVQSEAAASAMAATPGGYQQLTGTISAPAEATRGAVLRYTVTLSNGTSNPVSLASCPAYTQSVYAAGKTSTNTVMLNCAGAGNVVPAHSSVSFEMQAAIPAGLAAGDAKLSWKLDGGPAVGTAISLR